MTVSQIAVTKRIDFHNVKVQDTQFIFEDGALVIFTGCIFSRCGFEIKGELDKDSVVGNNSFLEGCHPTELILAVNRSSKIKETT